MERFQLLSLRRPAGRITDYGLAFAAGVMLTAGFTSLIIPGIERGGVAEVLIGLLIGALLISSLDKIVPHMHLVGGLEGPSTGLSAIWLFAIAVTIHNVPEGLSVGVGIGAGDIPSGLALMIAIGIQNIPEGLSVGLALFSTKQYSRWKSFLAANLSGIVELPLSILGALAVIHLHQVIPYTMGIAAGAMLFVISDEIIPEVQRRRRRATV